MHCRLEFGGYRVVANGGIQRRSCGGSGVDTIGTWFLERPERITVHFRPMLFSDVPGRLGLSLERAWQSMRGLWFVAFSEQKPVVSPGIRS